MTRDTRTFTTTDIDPEEIRIGFTSEERFVRGGIIADKDEVPVIEPSSESSMSEKYGTPTATGNKIIDIQNTNRSLQGTLQFI